MNILCIEPYFGGSHEHFINSWQKNSAHNFDIVTLPPNKWKWRMRHSATHFANIANNKLRQGQKYDCIFCSDMLNLAEFLGLADQGIAKLPKVVYFHENQLTYPQRFEKERDYQYVMTNFTTALAADKVIFNSNFHKNDFLNGLKRFFKKMPDFHPLKEIEMIEQKSSAVYPGIDPVEIKRAKAGPLMILWAGRWEHDKNPEDFFKAINLLKDKGCKFKLNVIGEQFRDSPEIFKWAKKHFESEINRWGYQQSREQYHLAMAESDVVVSTAIHEFFGITMLEAMSAGAIPLLPDRLAYPEIIKGYEKYLYDGTAEDLAERLIVLASEPELARDENVRNVAAKFGWKGQAKELDMVLERV